MELKNVTFLVIGELYLAINITIKVLDSYTICKL